MPGGLRLLPPKRTLQHRREATTIAEPGGSCPRSRQSQGEGATRFCMGAAWREVPQGKEFDSVLEMVRRVATLNLEVCCTLGMLDRGTGPTA